MTLQFAAIITLAASAHTIPVSPFGRALLGLGIVIGIWAIVEMRRSKLRIQPEVATGATLVTTGPYRLIRNPMYLAVLLSTLGWYIDRPMLFRASIWVGLLIVLILKMRHEEKLLTQAFEDYPEYISHTTRLIPYIW